jgi:hypothetical protein
MGRAYEIRVWRERRREDDADDGRRALRQPHPNDDVRNLLLPHQVSAPRD